MQTKYLEIPDLSGGINRKPSERLMKPNEAYNLENVDLSTPGLLKSAKGKTLTLSKTNLQQIYKYNRGKFLATDKDDLYDMNLSGMSSILSGFGGTFQAKKSGQFTYLTNGDQFKKYNGSEISQVGIEKPATAPTITVKAKDMISDCDSTEPASNWVASANVDISAVNDDFMEGDKSLKTRTGTAFTTGRYIKLTSIPSDLSAYDGIGFWMKSDNNMDAGDLTMRILDGTDAVKTSMDLPILVANTWTYVFLEFPDTSLVASGCAVLDFYFNIDPNLIYIWFDAIEANGGPLNGEYYWYYSYYSEYDQEGVLSDASEVVSLERAQVTVTFETSDDAQIDTRKLYRLGGSLSTTFLVDTIEDNTTTTYVDKKGDDELTVAVSSSDYDSPQTRIGSLLEYCDDRLFMAGITATPKRLHFSRTTPYLEVWPEEYFIDFIDDITAIFNLNENLLIFTKENIYKLTGSSPDDYVLEVLPWSKPCFSPRSIVKYSGYALFLSNKGLYITDGANVTYISEKLEGMFDAVDTQAKGIIIENNYYLIYNGQTIVADLIRFPNITYYTLEHDPNSYFYDTEDNIFYYIDDVGLYEMESGADLEFTFEKNQFSLNNAMVYKFLRKVWVNIKGSITLEIYKEEDEIASYTKTQTATVMSKKEFSLPFDLKAKYFRIKLIGTGIAEPPIIFMFTSMGLQ